MVDLPTELQEEFEVVQAIYGDEAVRHSESQSEKIALRFEVDLQPRVEQGAGLVSVSLTVEIPMGYPANAAPQITVERSRGLSNADLRALLAAAEKAVSVHGHQEVGCVAELLGEVSEALDIANEICECSICLQSCSPSEPAVRALCDHVFHAACIGRWSTLKDAEAEAAAGEATRNVRAERDRVHQDIDETYSREVDAKLGAEEARAAVAKYAMHVDVVRARLQGKECEIENAEAPIEEDDAPWDAEYLEMLVDQVKGAKADLQRRQAEEKRAQSRISDLRKKLETLEAELAAEAAGRATAGLPCPVCRVPISRSLLSAFPYDATKAIEDERGVDTSVSALPKKLRKTVLLLQQEQAMILARRQQKERFPDPEPSSMETATPSCVGATTVPPVPTREEIEGTGVTKGKGRGSQVSRKSASAATSQSLDVKEAAHGVAAIGQRSVQQVEGRIRASAGKGAPRGREVGLGSSHPTQDDAPPEPVSGRWSSGRGRANGEWTDNGWNGATQWNTSEPAGDTWAYDNRNSGYGSNRRWRNDRWRGSQ